MTRAIVIGSPLYAYLFYKSKALKFTNIAPALKVKTSLKACVVVCKFFKNNEGFKMIMNVVCTVKVTKLLMVFLL